MNRIALSGTLAAAFIALASARDAAIADAPASLPTSRAAYQVRFQLSDGSDAWPADKREAIIAAIEPAVALYNEVGEFDKLVTVNYSPSTPTADANYDGWINFGKQIGKRTALHELGHCMGIGTVPRWRELIVDGKWTGEHALSQLRAFDGPDAVLYADRQHFWPYGLNFDKESSPENDRRHVMMVMAFRKDLGIKNGEPQPERRRRRDAATQPKIVEPTTARGAG